MNGFWLSKTSGSERRTLGAAMGGWALDAMDVQIYSFVIPTLIAVWGISRTAAGTVGTAALLTSAVGGWLAGWLADRIGRVRVLQISILWFAFFTLLSGLAQNYDQLLAVRGLMGLGFGGEWAAGAVLLGETMRPQFRGRALGLMQAGWAIGWAVAALLYVVAFSFLPAAQAWRAMFLAGVSPAVLVFFLRRLISESPTYVHSKQHDARSSSAAFVDIFKPPLLKVTVLGGLVGTGAQGGYTALTTWLPTFLRTERGLSVLDSAGYLAVFIVGSFCGYITGGYLSDLLGRRATFLAFAVGAGILVVLDTAVPLDNFAALILGFPLGFCSAGVFSGMGAFFTEQFPTRVRGVGQGFAYNIGRAIGAVFPALVGLLSGRLGLGLAIGVFAGVAYSVMAVAAFLLPETKGKMLTA